MKKTLHRSHDLMPLGSEFKNFLGDFWSFPTIFDSPSWEKNTSFLPAMDISQTEKEFEITADIPGFDPKDIEVHVENEGIVISGKHEDKKQENEKNYLRVERSSGSFYRKVNFPPSADLENVTCKSKNGVLFVRIPKRKEAEKKALKIEVE